MDAHGALDSLLGRLTTILVEEAQLLGRVRGDVEFIKEEMECMNSVILQITEAQHRDHLVRAWMKQVVGLTRDCEGNVEHYIHYVGVRPGDDDGLLGYLRRIARFLRTIPVRHRIATRIRELKVRARDVGDRRQRYGVTVPQSTSVEMNALGVEPSGGDENHWRRGFLLHGVDCPPADNLKVIRRGIDTVIKCLSTEPEDGLPQTQVRVFSIYGDAVKNVAEGVYQEHSTLFDCKAWSGSFNGDIGKILTETLEQVGHAQHHPGQVQVEDEITNQAAATADEDREKQLIAKIHGHLKGKRFLVVVKTDDIAIWQLEYYKVVWKRLLDALLQAADGCLPGSAIIMTTNEYNLALSVSPYKIIDARSITLVYSGLAGMLDAQSVFANFEWALTRSSAFARTMYLHLMYVKPAMTEAEHRMCRDAISMGMSLRQSLDHTMVMLCYNELPSKYRSCLLHLTIFPQGHVIKTTRLARRWTAEGLVTTGEETEREADKGEQYIDVLFIRGFISPVEISAAGNVKSFTLKDEVHKVIAKIAREVNIVDTDLPIDLARHLSIHNRIVLPKSHGIADSKDIAASIPSLAASTQWQLLKVLDLEGCHGLEKQHLKSICKILLLKYLSLRSTDVTELPMEIKELQCLETLDVRQTKVRVLSKKVIVLPLLKHFLAGHKLPAANDSAISEDSFSAVEVPLCIGKMSNMEILSHVRVSNCKEVAAIVELLKLRKLGVALHGKHTMLSDLFCQIEALHRCLRSLSIRMGPLVGSQDHDEGEVEALPSLPEFITSLNISGVSSGLTRLIQDRHQLVMVKLSEVYLKEDGIRILGSLNGLCYLRLQYKSYTKSELSFRGDEFQSLSYLLVEGIDVTKISFDVGAAIKLERIVWSFAAMEALSGVGHLPKLKKLELNGDCKLDPIEEELEKHPNFPRLKHKPHHHCQEDGNAKEASSSSSAP